MLRGLMDTNGSIASDKGSQLKVTFSTLSIKLANDVTKLSRSLGLRANVAEYERNRDDETHTEYVVTLQAENYKKKDLFKFNTTSLEKADKVESVRSSRNYKNVKIISVTETEELEDMTCIYVSNSEHLFLANDFVVTHNTTFVHDLYGDRVLHIMTEKRYKTLEGAYVQYVSSWAEYLQVMRQIKNKDIKEQFDVISVDTVDNLYGLLEKFVAAKWEEESVGERDDLWGKDWNDLRDM